VIRRRGKRREDEMEKGTKRKRSSNEGVCGRNFFFGYSEVMLKKEGSKYEEDCVGSLLDPF